MTRLNINPLHLLSLPAILLAAALTVPVSAQDASATQPVQPVPTSVGDQPPAPQASKYTQTSKEGFWGRVNPFVRKKWLKKQLDPINDRLGELDQVNGQNAKDIRDVDERAQAGIRKAQGTADSANQTATQANSQAQQANTAAMNANNHIDKLNHTINSLDNYSQKVDLVIAFRGSQPVLSAEARKQLDDLATTLNGQTGYILELESHSPGAGNVGIANSQRLADAVKRYLVVDHKIPVYRMHSVALGNAKAQEGDAAGKPVRTGSVLIRLMENSLAEQSASTSQPTTPVAEN